MDKDIYKEIFAKNLRYYMNLNNKSQIDLIEDLGFNKSAVSTWYNGTRLPRMDKVDALAKYFNVKRSDLIEDHTSDEPIPDAPELAPHEEELLGSYRQLNDVGQEVLRDDADTMVRSGKYKKHDEPELVEENEGA